MPQTIVKVLKRFVVLFVNFILGGVAGFCLPAHFATVYATLGVVVPIILFAFIQYKDKEHMGQNLASFLVGGFIGFVFLLYILRLWWAYEIP